MGEPIGKREIFRKYPDVVDVPQLCEMLGGSRPVSKKTAYRMLNAGKIKAFRIGRSYHPQGKRNSLFAERNTRRLQHCQCDNRQCGVKAYIRYHMMPSIPLDSRKGATQ